MASRAAKKAAKKKSARKVVRSATKKTPVPGKNGDLPHMLDALLHTMRCIAQHEDELCTLLHDARRTHRVSASLLRELRNILRELPAEEYVNDLHAVQQALPAA